MRELAYRACGAEASNGPIAQRRIVTVDESLWRAIIVTYVSSRLSPVGKSGRERREPGRLTRFPRS
jgi:hypothetical protein